MEEFALFKTQEAIKFLKDNFETLLAKKLNLLRVSAPLFVLASTGYNDELSGKEERVSFSCKGEKIEIVQSLAKWKRHALKEYGFPVEKGLYTDMNAIRKDENMDALHSIYVDQWDWEKQILPEQRNKKYLFQTVKDIYAVIVKLAHKAQKRTFFIYSSKSVKTVSFSSKKLFVHVGEEFLVGFGELHLVFDKFHGLQRGHVGEVTTQHPYAL